MRKNRNLTQNHIGILKERVLRALNNPKMHDLFEMTLDQIILLCLEIGTVGK